MKLLGGKCFNTSRGYTITEVMIYLGVTGALLVSALTMINGQEESARFSQSVATFDQELQDVFNDVSTGYYSTTSDFTCTSTKLGANYTVNLSTATQTQQGSNYGCVFLGKVIDLGTATSRANYDVYTMVGARPADSLNNTGTKLLRGGGVGGNPGIVDQTQNPAELGITAIKSRTDPARSLQGIALISDFSKVSGVNDIAVGSASRIKIYEYSGNYNDNPKPASNFELAGEGVTICLQAGVGGRRAAIIVGRDGSLGTERIIEGPLPTECPA